MEIKNKLVGIISDIHIGLGNDSKIYHENVLKFSKWASDAFLNKGVSDILFPGDIFHNRNEISVETLSIAKKFFENFADFRIFISTGNHDCFLKNKSDINSISILNGWSNISVFDEKIGELNYKDKKITMIPWGVEGSSIPNSDYMFGHFEINTFNMNTYKICEHGISSESLLKKSPFVISGHFHTRQIREYKKGKICYVGSPYQQNFGDESEKRGIHILNLENSELEFIENNISPKFYKIHVSKYENDDNIVDILENNIISLVIDKKISPEDILNLKNSLSKNNPVSIRVDYECSDDKLNNQEEKNDYNSSNILKSIEDFVDTLQIENKQETIDYLKDLYYKLT